MFITAKSDYAVRAMLSLARHDTVPVARPEHPHGDWRPMTIEVISEEQGLPCAFLHGILGDLRRARLVQAHRGDTGGYALARPASNITLGAVLRAVDGPLAEIGKRRPEETTYAGSAEHLTDVWVAMRNALRTVLDGTTVADVLSGDLPDPVRAMVATDDAWAPR